MPKYIIRRRYHTVCDLSEVVSESAKTYMVKPFVVEGLAFSNTVGMVPKDEVIVTTNDRLHALKMMMAYRTARRRYLKAIKDADDSLEKAISAIQKEGKSV